MKKFNLLILLISMTLLFFGGCNKVESGYVGVKVYLLGGEKGVDSEVLGPGRYWIGMNEDLYLFPTFTQTYSWTVDKTESSTTDESFTFQTKEGLQVNADIGISYKIESDKVSDVFQKYRKGVDEITHTFLRNIVRNAFNKVTSDKKVEDVYGLGKAKLLEEVTELVRSEVHPIGIDVEYIAFIGALRLPESVTQALDLKIRATQIAEQRENELREAEASAKMIVAKANGDAEAELIRARAAAQSNLLVSKSLTQELVNYEAIKKWDGKLSQVSGMSTPFISLK